MNLVFLFAAAILSALTIYRLLLRPQMEGQPDGDAGRYRLLLLLAALLAVAVRVYRFGGVPGGFNQDGAMAAIDAKALADYGTDHYGMRWPVHLTAWGYGQMSALLSYLMAPCIKLFGFHAVSLRLPQLLVSLLGLAALYLFCRDAFGKGPALAVWLAVAWPFILVMAINFFRWDTIETPLFTLPYFAGSVRSGDILFFSENIPAQLWQNMKALADAVIIQTPDLPCNSIGQFGSLYLFSLPFAIAGLVWLLKRLKTSDGAVLLLLFFVTGVWCGLCTNNVNINRVNIIFYPMLCFTGLGLYAVGRCVRVRFLRPGLAAGYLLAFCLFCGCYFGPYAQQIEGYFLKDFGDAVASLKDSPAEKLYITGKSQGENTAYVSQVLTLFYHETDAEYFQGKRQLPGLLPFRERYTFANMEQLVIDPQENAAYVAAEEELKFFEPGVYEMEQYGSYYVLRTKGE